MMRMSTIEKAAAASWTAASRHHAFAAMAQRDATALPSAIPKTTELTMNESP